MYKLNINRRSMLQCFEGQTIESLAINQNCFEKAPSSSMQISTFHCVPFFNLNLDDPVDVLACYQISQL